MPYPYFSEVGLTLKLCARIAGISELGSHAQLIFDFEAVIPRVFMGWPISLLGHAEAQSILQEIK